MEAQQRRSLAGEIDLIFKTSVCWVFVEVKKSQNYERAAQLFMGQVRSAPCMATRFDLALIDRFGAILIVENVFFSEDFQEPSEMGFI